MNNATVDADAKVQCITKKSSDELLRKFAELGSDDSGNALRRKKKKKREDGQGGGTTLVEMWSLLPPPATRRTAVLRRLGIGRAHLRARDIRNKSLLGIIGKTWRGTVEGASRVFMERHYHRHKRLISDIV
ncbi:uncharacterized protein LOC133307902 [Gastrolobium bilobum]|uniref:uncharacterized protein LOC133307902 n=1 Tax=Gastrolobium bilobum TaxID=150636 RepID=UPI002AB30CBD|nr:uncharacterized protein LOC133307902 [Gastrolobium bilobum]